MLVGPFWGAFLAEKQCFLFFGWPVFGFFSVGRSDWAWCDEHRQIHRVGSLRISEVVWSTKGTQLQRCKRLRSLAGAVAKTTNAMMGEVQSFFDSKGVLVGFFWLSCFFWSVGLWWWWHSCQGCMQKTKWFGQHAWKRGLGRRQRKTMQEDADWWRLLFQYLTMLLAPHFSDSVGGQSVC